jgi:hypothetical protein
LPDVSIAGGRDGEIKDLIVNAETGEVRHAVTKLSVDKGGERLHALPLQTFTLGADNKLSFSDRSALSQRKSWTEDKWPGMQEREYWGDGSAVPACIA